MSSGRGQGESSFLCYFVLFINGQILHPARHISHLTVELVKKPHLMCKILYNQLIRRSVCVDRLGSEDGAEICTPFE
jgi:hypothetical protein